MKRKLIFALVAALLLTPWPVAYAYDEVAAVNSPGSIIAAEPAATPKLSVFGNAIGGVTPGDLFYVDISGSTADTFFTLYITNTDELVKHYRYMTFNIGLYVQTGTDQWERVIAREGETPLENYLTMQNGLVSFRLPGYAQYKVTIDQGCFYAWGAGADGNAVLPKFYLTAS